MKEGLKAVLRHGPWTPSLVRWKARSTRPTSQNGEHAILADLAQRYDVPHLFVEFGFGGWEFNCTSMAEDGWNGLLVDNDRYNIVVANTLYGLSVKATSFWVDLESIKQIEDWVDGRPLGILSIDVDGNDYWFLERLIGLRPAIISCEYNSILGQRPLAMPYRADHDRWKAPHTRYAGASLTALDQLATRNGYRLVSQLAGINAFFVREDLIGAEKFPDAAHLYQARCVEDWADLKTLEWVEV